MLQEQSSTLSQTAQAIDLRVQEVESWNVAPDGIIVSNTTRIGNVETRAGAVEAARFMMGGMDYMVGYQGPKKGNYDILVSTTVVEVGVDVPNATVIVIENAERFGLSQLHQLRGRVGRSDIQSYCILVSSSNKPETTERLSIMTETNDGFVIAEKDLQLRGPGEFLGVRQSGLPDLLISDIVRDAKILEYARNEAIDFVKKYNEDDFPLLKNVTSLEMFTGLDI